MVRNSFTFGPLGGPGNVLYGSFRAMIWADPVRRLYPPGNRGNRRACAANHFHARSGDRSQAVLEVRRAAIDNALREKAGRAGVEIAAFSPAPIWEPELWLSRLPLHAASLGCIWKRKRRQHERIFRQFKEENRRFSGAKSRFPDAEMAEKTP